MSRRPLIGAKETAEFLNINLETLYDWVQRRRIPYYKIGRSVKFDPQDLDRWVEERRVEICA